MTINMRATVHKHSIEVRTSVSYTGYSTSKGISSYGKCPENHGACAMNATTQYPIEGSVSYGTTVYQTDYVKNMRERVKHSHTVSVQYIQIHSTLVGISAYSCGDGHTACTIASDYVPVLPLSYDLVSDVWVFTTSKKNMRDRTSHSHSKSVDSAGIGFYTPNYCANGIAGACAWGHSNCRVRTLGWRSVSYARVVGATFTTDTADW